MLSFISGTCDLKCSAILIQMENLCNCGINFYMHKCLKKKQFRWTLDPGYVNNLVKKKIQLSCKLSVAAVCFPIALEVHQKGVFRRKMLNELF